MIVFPITGLKHADLFAKLPATMQNRKGQALKKYRIIFICILVLSLLLSCQKTDPNHPDKANESKGPELLEPAPEIPRPKPPDTKMILIVGGNFMMGKIDGSNGTDPILSETSVDSFYMDAHEVTAGQYDACIQADACENPQVDAESEDAFSKNWRVPGRENHPINWVTYENAQQYCTWRGARLPTEKEFEYALRGGLSDKKYPWGDGQPTGKPGNYGDETYSKMVPDLPKIDDKKSNIRWPHVKGYDDGFPGTSPACSFPRDGRGFCDLSGNVWELCTDKVSEDGNMHVMRGGSWHNDLKMIRTTARYILASDGFPHVGFRCVKSAKKK